MEIHFYSKPHLINSKSIGHFSDTMVSFLGDWGLNIRNYKH